MRVFFACLPPADCLPRLAQWQDAMHVLAGGRKLPLPQLHLTLAFLGEVGPLALQRAADCAEQAAASLPDSLLLDSCGSWDSGIGWCGPARSDAALQAWVYRLRRALRLEGLAVENRPYQPHLTLLRKLQQALPPQPVPPLRLELREVALIASSRRADGAGHLRLDGWRRAPGS
ncbi:2'-5' RNA ligase [Chromobacterium sphagni]|uniref:RNA 2',3'-cyclic phosphodiesterase n=1 Tax=Chromobacterium sphagni TaxID=1903179 RepID=A0A1S1WXU5_9NEIS|nr:RNA 2',3'-cyclic phosphodiesterase [Chromobacterium sphagni]OHX12092.1 2'-5' RNA ligase [Chromobacterium sphagni]